MSSDPILTFINRINEQSKFVALMDPDDDSFVEVRYAEQIDGELLRYERRVPCCMISGFHDPELGADLTIEQITQHRARWVQNYFNKQRQKLN